MGHDYNPITKARLPPSRQITDLDVTDLGGFRGLDIGSARQVLCGDVSRPSLDRLCKHLSSVLGRTELCHEVWNPESRASKTPNHPQRKPPFGTGQC